ncbi:BrnA antitoxin family protein [Luteibacter yeojuensis]|uniref:BrnA antitoxin of type II toxin-antitoxin system n=1 Tax=Luteibacter yeojuensis TaxID=345309 RepID=A0A7X5TQ60_9GAMM|nr:BrnA antitoxin family protein [Luteibacter yeojuensis]NID15454.1 hypothetical protein [Luteibacter yeojuensis]
MKRPTTGKTVRYTIDLDAPPSFTPEEIAELDALEGRPVDFSDIPEQVDDGKWYRPGKFEEVINKQQVTLRIDRDVLEFFRSSGQRYQTRINNVLRDYMLAHQATPPQKRSR